MALEEVLDSVRRIIHKWVNTFSPLAEDAHTGDTILTLMNVKRFAVGEQVMLKKDNYYETGLIIKSINRDNQTIELTTPIQNNWTMAENTVLIKTINEQFVQGIYFGDPSVISKFPAITVNGTSRTSEWMTLESTKERYEIEIGVYVLDSTHEAGFRFLTRLVDLIQKGLKHNIMPLIYDADFISLKESIEVDDINLKVNDQDKLNYYRRIIVENPSDFQENWVEKLYDDGETIKMVSPMVIAFDAEDTTVIVPHRFIFNSWPATIDYGKIHKGDLLKAAVIRWFAEEEEMQYFRREEGKLY